MKVEDMREGDFYRWSYKPESMPAGGYTYWCCSCTAEVRGGRLVDTYWSAGDGRSWPLDEAAEKLDLVFVANRDEIEPCPYSDPYDRYKREDVVDLSHPNGGRVYVRKGAKPDRDVQVAAWRRKLELAEREASWCRDKIAELEAADA